MEKMPFISKNEPCAKGYDDRQSRLAEEVAFHRVIESFRPECDRICNDPYAIRFLGNDLKKYLEFCAGNPEEARKRAEQINRIFPGVQNSIIARVRYFDDFIKEATGVGLEQLVILGAGYDTRAYRIDGIKENVKVFEIDYPDTQSRKTAIIRDIFSTLPEHVTYLPIDVEEKNFARQLEESGYSGQKKTLFVLEGLTYYIDEAAVKTIFSFIVHNSMKGSSILFDYLPESVIDGTCPQDVARNMRARAMEYGEVFRFGILEGTICSFLEKEGFCNVHNVTCADLKTCYFHGNNANRQLCDLFAFASAEVP